MATLFLPRLITGYFQGKNQSRGTPTTPPVSVCWAKRRRGWVRIVVETSKVRRLLLLGPCRTVGFMMIIPLSRSRLLV